MNTIFGLQPFQPKRELILPHVDGEIRLYVLDGRAYPAGCTIRSVHFDGWTPRFENTALNVPVEHLVRPVGGIEYYVLEVVFRLVPAKGRAYTPEIVAVSYDGCKTFYPNKLCTLPQEHAKA